MLLFRWVEVLSIEIETCEIATIVAVYHSVNIEHGNNVEHEVFSQYFGLNTISYQIINHIFDLVTHHAFSGMYPRGKNYRFFAILILVEFEIRYFHIVATKILGSKFVYDYLLPAID